MEKRTPKTNLSAAAKSELAAQQQTIALLKGIAGGHVAFKKTIVVQGRVQQADVYPTAAERRLARAALQKIISGRAGKRSPLTGGRNNPSMAPLEALIAGYNLKAA